jgi:hypothetical protein
MRLRDGRSQARQNLLIELTAMHVATHRPLTAPTRDWTFRLVEGFELCICRVIAFEPG